MLSNVSNEDLYRTINSFNQEFDSAKNNVSFARNMLAFLGDNDSGDANAVYKVRDLVDLNIDRSKVIQKYLYSSPPGFFVSHYVDLNNFSHGLSENKNNVVKTVMYSYGQETEISRIVPETVMYLDKESNLSNKNINSVLQEPSKEWVGTKAGERRTIKIQNIEVSFRWCPAGTFLMGSPKTETGQVDDEAQVKVTLSKGFWMCETEVTQQLYKAVMGFNPSQSKGDYRLPVEMVSWDDAQLFIRKINESQTGQLNVSYKVDLPTEAQWEYACRAGSKQPFCFGNDTNLLTEYARIADNSSVNTLPVGMLRPNNWGLLDMHGNVWEWCADMYDVKLSGGIDPHGPTSGSSRVYRGGSCYNGANNCRSSYRDWYEPSRQFFFGGIRLALNPS